MAPLETATLPRNHLLATLPGDMRAALMPKLSHVVLPLRQELYRPDDEIEAVYFVESGVISLVAILEDGMQGEVGLIGREGMLGTSILSGVDTSYVEAVVQMSGSAWRMAAAPFRRELDTNPALRLQLLRYNEALQAQVMQTAACNGRHELEPRLARWLLMAADRYDGNELPLTQEFMAVMLGVHRPSITITAGILQRAGLIRYPVAGSRCWTVPAWKPRRANATGPSAGGMPPCWERRRIRFVRNLTANDRSHAVT